MNNNPLLKGKVPARYIGEHSILLSPLGKPYFDAQGKPLQSLALRKGDTLHINEGEARGESWLHDPAREKESLWLGTGKRVKEEHKDLSEEEWEILGYDHQKGRSDFIEIAPDGKPVKQAAQSADPAQISKLSAILDPQITASGELLKTDAEGKAKGA